MSGMHTPLGMLRLCPGRREFGGKPRGLYDQNRCPSGAPCGGSFTSSSEEVAYLGALVTRVWFFWNLSMIQIPHHLKDPKLREYYGIVLPMGNAKDFHHQP